MDKLVDFPVGVPPGRKMRPGNRERDLGSMWVGVVIDIVHQRSFVHLTDDRIQVSLQYVQFSY